MRIALALLSLLIVLPSTARAQVRPNVLVIMTDDMAATDLPYMPKTLALVGAAGMTFTQALVSSPLCCPSRASFFRGQYAHNHGVWRNGDYPMLQPLEGATLATALTDLGYRTGLVGKYANGYGKFGDLHVPPGWSEWLAKTAPRGKGFSDNGVEVIYSPEAYPTDLFRDRALAFIASAPAPWFLYVATHAPHAPAKPATRHAELFNDVTLPRPPSFNVVDVTKPAWLRALPLLSATEIAAMERLHRNRLRSLQAVDEMVEALVVALDAAGQLENTYILFTSDNGYHLGQHRMRALPHLRSWKESPYDVDVRVPMLVRGPGIPAGTTTAKLATNVDLAPTILRLAGGKLRTWMDGRALDGTLFGELTGGRSSVLLEMEPDPIDPPPPAYRGLRTARYLYVEWGTGEKELYDRSIDPHEVVNVVAGADACVLDALTMRLAAMKVCARTECRLIEREPLPACAQ